MQIKFARPNLTDEDKMSVLRAMESDVLTEGSIVADFEAEFSKITGGFAYAVSSCTAALHLANLAVGVKGKDVIVPAMTHAATALAVVAAGGKPVFVDCESDGNLSRAGVQASITKNTAAISVVHFLGNLCYIGEFPIPIIEDCALTPALMTQYGDYGCFSFYPAKHITSGEGGMVVCKKPGHRIAKMRAFGKTHNPFNVDQFGINYRMSEINAALGRSQLKRLSRITSQRYANMAILRDEFSDYDCIFGNYAVSIMSEERDRVRDALAYIGIETSVYYPVPAPHLTYFSDAGGYPNAEKIANQSITLSVGPHLGPEEMRYTAKMVKKFIK